MIVDVVDNNDGFAPLPKPESGDWLDIHSEPGQTFEQFLTQPRNEINTNNDIICLQPLWDFDTLKSPSLERLKEFTESYFKVQVKLLPVLHPKSDNFSPRINVNTKKIQVNALEILGYLYERIPVNGYCVLGITMFDLYPDPEWNYVFGYASYTQRVGVFSFARYSPSFYNEEVDSAARSLLLLRSCKILAHETGHMFGMAHCTAYHCNMNGCNNLEENDAQPMHLCPVCLKKLQHTIGFDINNRYKKLETFYSKEGFIEQVQWIKKRLN
jgi:archaemetzincin